MKQIFNMNMLVSVQIFNVTPCNNITYLREVRSLWKRVRKAGFYASDIPGRCFSKEELEQGAYHGVKLIVNEEKAYYTPFIVLQFVNGEKWVERFEKYEEADMFGKARISQSSCSRFTVVR